LKGQAAQGEQPVFMACMMPDS